MRVLTLLKVYLNKLKSESSKDKQGKIIADVMTIVNLVLLHLKSNFQHPEDIANQRTECG